MTRTALLPHERHVDVLVDRDPHRGDKWAVRIERQDEFGHFRMDHLSQWLYFDTKQEALDHAARYRESFAVTGYPLAKIFINASSIDLHR